MRFPGYRYGLTPSLKAGARRGRRGAWRQRARGRSWWSLGSGRRRR